MKVTEDDLTNELRKLHTDYHPAREEGEFTIIEYATVNNLTYDKAESILKHLFRMGKLTRPPRRYINGQYRTVYKIE